MVEEFEIPMMVWFRYRDIETVQGSVEIKDVFRDDARSLYEMVMSLNSNEGGYRGKMGTISRVLDKTRELFFASEDCEDSGKSQVGTLRLNVDELELIEEMIDKPPDKAEVRGHVNTTLVMIQSYIKEYKSEYPELFGRERKDDKDADDSEPGAEQSKKKDSSALKDRMKKRATKSSEVGNESG